MHHNKKTSEYVTPINLAESRQTHVESVCDGKSHDASRDLVSRGYSDAGCQENDDIPQCLQSDTQPSVYIIL